MKVFVTWEDPPRGVHYRLFCEEVEKVGEFVHRQEFHTTKINVWWGKEKQK